MSISIKQRWFAPCKAWTMKFDTTLPSAGMHARSVGIEYPRDLDLEAMLAVIIEEQGFGATLSFIIT